MQSVRIAVLYGGCPPANTPFRNVRLFRYSFTLSHCAAWQSCKIANVVQLISKQISIDCSINDHLWRNSIDNILNFVKYFGVNCYGIKCGNLSYIPAGKICEWLKMVVLCLQVRSHTSARGKDVNGGSQDLTS
jgi:hypothetical protein